MNPAISVRNLSKRFQKKIAVDNVTFDVEPGEFFGFLGPNGAGKTTTIKMLCGMMKCDAGEARVAGIDVFNDPLGVKARIGVLPDTIETFDRLTGWELVNFCGLLYSIPEAETKRRAVVLLDLLSLSDEDRGKLVIDYSMGMKKKVGLACALIHGPEVLFLDEPFNGIDPIATAAIQVVLNDLASKGVTIFFTSHVLEVVEKICTRIGIIKDGRLLAAGTRSELAAFADLGSSASLSDVFVRVVGGVATPAKALDWIASKSPAPLAAEPPVNPSF
ncbi:MAG: ABC transporter ATP-binding protein [Planctomycetota bacterium]